MHTDFLIMREENAIDLPLPKRHTMAAAGMDLHANVYEPICIKKGSRCLIPTGIKVALPFGYEAQIRPRSGLALKHGITVLNTPGTVDADYRGELKVLLVNLGEDDFIVNRGDRVAQLMIAKVEMAEFTLVDSLPDSPRGDGGYGSTGVTS
ncbi:MAG: dUTP diphosphatase [Defluviitaleaceae bacterium]|nr:dUTP diphosphatase [Defluviitaleaceae bacterium]